MTNYMQPEMKENLDLLVENNQMLKKEFKWENDLVTRLAAFLYARENRNVDVNAIRECCKLIKDNTGIFSAFRNDITLATLLSLADDAKDTFAQVKKAYDTLKSARFYDSDYLVMAAYQIATNVDQDKYTDVIKKARAFYDEMKARHWFLTGDDDYILSVMLGLSDIDVDRGSASMELLYDRLVSEFKFNKNSVQTISQILILANKSEEAAQRVIDIKKALKEQKLSLDNTDSLAMLSLLSLLPEDVGTIVENINEVQTYLNDQKGFRGFLVSKEELLMFSIAMVATKYCQDIENKLVTSMLSASVIGIIYSEIIMMMIMMNMIFVTV